MEYKKPKWDKFRKLFNENRYVMPDPEEVEKRDITPVFYAELYDLIRHNEIILININGIMRTGKSTVALEICRFINEELLGKTMNASYIDADQSMFQDRVNKSPNMVNQCRVIDEYNKMSDTGLGSSVRNKEAEQFTEVQAVRLIHKISCSPDTLTDNMTQIILDIISKDKENKGTWCLLKYRSKTASGTQVLPLGRVFIDVSKTLGAKWYKLYNYKKEKRIDIYNKDNILDDRDPKEASALLHFYNNYKLVCKFRRIQRAELLVSLRNYLRKKIERGSFLSEDRLLKSISGLLDKVYFLEKMKSELKLAQLGKTKRLYSPEEVSELQEIIKIEETALFETIEYYLHLQKVYKDYCEVDNLTENKLVDTEFNRLLEQEKKNNKKYLRKHKDLESVKI